MAIYPAASTLSLMMFEELINICSSTLSMPDCLIYRINKFRLLLFSSTRHIYSMNEAEKRDENGKMFACWVIRKSKNSHIIVLLFPLKGDWAETRKMFVSSSSFLCCCCFLFTFHKTLTPLLLLMHEWIPWKYSNREREARNSIHIFLEPEQLSHITIYRIFRSGICVLAVESYPNMCKTRKGIIERWWWHNTAKKKEKRIHIVQCLFVQIQHLFVWVKQQIYFVILFASISVAQALSPSPTPTCPLCVWYFYLFDCRLLPEWQ